MKPPQLLTALRTAHNHNLRGSNLISTLALVDGPLNQTVLARECGITTAAMTRVRDRLVQMGIVADSPTTTDRRYIMCQLTEKGIAAAAEILSAK